MRGTEMSLFGEGQIYLQVLLHEMPALYQNRHRRGVCIGI